MNRAIVLIIVDIVKYVSIHRSMISWWARIVAR